MFLRLQNGRGKPNIFKHSITKQGFYIYTRKDEFMNNRFSDILKQLGKFISNFSVQENGIEYIFDGDVIHEGLEISTYDEKGDIVPLEDGEYTIQGIKCIVRDGKVAELPEKESKMENNNNEDENKSDENVGDGEKDPEKPLGNAEYADGRINELLAEIEALKAENEALKKENAELRSVPMDKPVPQRTNMSSESIVDVPDHIKGTKHEKAFKIFSK